MTTPSTESASGAGSSSSQTGIQAAIDRVLEWGPVQVLRPLLHMIAYYPLLLIVPVLLLLISWNVLMRDYDAFHQLWNEDAFAGGIAGFFAATILGQTLLAVYLLDEDRDNRNVVRRLRVIPRWGYWGAWLLLLLVLVGPMVFYHAVFSSTHPDIQAVTRSARAWFPLGVLISLAMFGALRAVRADLFEKPEKVGLGVSIVLIGSYVALGVGHLVDSGAYLKWVPAPVSLLLLFGFITALLSAFTYIAGRRTAVLYPSLLGLFVVPFLIPSCQTEYRVPNMEVAGESGTYYDQPFRLAQYTRVRPKRPEGILLTNPAPDTGLETDSRQAKLDSEGLINDRGALLAWHAWMMKKYKEPQPVILVTVSGGASASALYCAEVLFTLEEEFPGFSDRIRLVSGASGGMLGAAYFVTQLREGGSIAEARKDERYRNYLDAVREYKNAERNKVGEAALAKAKARLQEVQQPYTDHMRKVREDFLRGLEKDFLGPIVQKWIHLDIPLGTLGRNTTNDRGLALELAWKRHLNGALDVPLRDLRAEEQTGRLPSLVFTPMMVEDGRQLIVSNLSLDYMVETARDNSNNIMSYMGVEFFRMFPRADGFRLSTAVRMSASFPYLSPSVALPTDPVRHVVDAGYYDNYGTTVATKWVNEHSQWLSGQLELTPERPEEVILLRIRCFGYESSRLQVVTEKELDEYEEETGPSTDGAKGLIKRWDETPNPNSIQTQTGLFSVTAPLFGLFSSWRANMVYRADERLGSTMARLRPRDDRPGVKLTPYPIECLVNPSLNWVLCRNHIAAIHADVKTILRKAATVSNVAESRMTDIPPEDKAQVEQTKATNKSDRMPTATELTTGDQKVNNLQPASRQSVQSQAEISDRLAKLTLPPKEDPPKK